MVRVAEEDDVEHMLKLLVVHRFLRLWLHSRKIRMYESFYTRLKNDTETDLLPEDLEHRLKVVRQAIFDKIKAPDYLLSKELEAKWKAVKRFCKKEFLEGQNIGKDAVKEANKMIKDGNIWMDFEREFTWDGFLAENPDE